VEEVVSAKEVVHPQQEAVTAQASIDKEEEEAGEKRSFSYWLNKKKLNKEDGAKSVPAVKPEEKQTSVSTPAVQEAEEIRVVAEPKPKAEETRISVKEEKVTIGKPNAGKEKQLKTEAPVKPLKQEPQPEQIINKFIEETPSISRPKAEFYNPVNMANLSVTPDEDMVTETLAKVHLKQGNFQKAIKIYQKLGLLKPDKLAYFNEQIEKIKQENKLS
jgi:hypothetical protein